MKVGLPPGRSSRCQRDHAFDEELEVVLAVSMSVVSCVSTGGGESSTGKPASLIPRQVIFGNPDKAAARLSPDGRWLAYQSNETGRREVYVQPFPGPGGKRQVSTLGGREPRWARNGQELFYREGNKMMVVGVTTTPIFTASNPRLLFEGRFIDGAKTYDVAPDGQRFLVVRPSEQEITATQIHVVLNWFEELKRLVPTGE